MLLNDSCHAYIEVVNNAFQHVFRNAFDFTFNVLLQSPNCWRIGMRNRKKWYFWSFIFILNRCTACRFGVCPFISKYIYICIYIAPWSDLRFGQIEHSRWVQKLPHVIIFVQALTLCLSANQYTLCSLLTNGQIPKRQAVQRLRYISIYAYAVGCPLI